MNNIFAKIIKLLIETPASPPSQTGPAAPSANNIPVSPSEEYGARVIHDQPAVINSNGVPAKVEFAQETKRGPRYYVKRFFPMTSFGEHTDLAGVGGQCQYPGCKGFGLKSRMGYCAECQIYCCPSHLKPLDDGTMEKKYCLTCFPEAKNKLNTWQIQQKMEEEAKKKAVQ